MRSEMIWIDNEVNNLDAISLDISKIVELVGRFQNLCIKRTNINNMVLNLLEARTYLESCLTNIKIIISPEENKLIKDVDEKHSYQQKLNDQYANLMVILDYEQKIILRYFEDTKLLASFILTASCKSFREKLVDYMETLVVRPLYNACTSFNNLSLKNKFDKKDLEKEELFCYLLFKEVFLSTQIKGSENRQKAMIASNSMGVTFKETNVSKQSRTKGQPPEEESFEFPPSIEDAIAELNQGEQNE